MIRQTPREKKKTTNVTFKFTPEMDKNLKELAAMENRSRTGEIEYLITRRLEELQYQKENEMLLLSDSNEVYRVMKETKEYIVIGQVVIYGIMKEEIYRYYPERDGRKKLFNLYLTDKDELKRMIDKMESVAIKWKRPEGGFYFYDSTGKELPNQ
jgi:hypothetical protein